MDFDVNKHVIFKTLTGSRVYGTSSPESDYDYRGVAVPPEIYYFGFQHRFDQQETKDPDSVIFGFSKFLKLATDNNPNVIELLFIEPEHWVVSSPEWEELRRHRDWFLCKKSFHTFRGYAHAQLKRVRSHRTWLLQGELQEPKREDFGLPAAFTIPVEVMGAADELARRFLGQEDIEENLTKLAQVDKPMATALRQRLYEYLELATGLSRHEMEDKLWRAAAQTLGYESNFTAALQKEKAYRQAKRHYESWLKWKAERNEKRKEIEAKCGYDSKHLGHVYRLANMCREILTTGTLTVTRPEAPFLREIREGKFTFDELETRYLKQDKELEVLYQQSTLQHQPRRNEIELLGADLTKRFLARIG